jgi:hypothetical protein
VLLNRIEFWTVRRKIEQAKRFAVLAAKLLDCPTSVPWCVIDENDEPRVLFEHFSDESHE